MERNKGYYVLSGFYSGIYPKEWDFTGRIKFRSNGDVSFEIWFKPKLQHASFFTLAKIIYRKLRKQEELISEVFIHAVCFHEKSKPITEVIIDCEN